MNEKKKQKQKKGIIVSLENKVERLIDKINKSLRSIFFNFGIDESIVDWKKKKREIENSIEIMRCELTVQIGKNLKNS